MHFAFKSGICGFPLWMSLIVLGYGFPEIVIAHPHVFADYSFASVFDDKGLRGVAVRWSFDEMYSSEIISRFDENKNNSFEAAEVNLLLNVGFAELPEEEYFVLVRVDGKARPVKMIKDFSASIKDRRLYCTFFIPLIIRAGKRPRSVDLTVYDKEFFIKFTLDRSHPVAFVNSSRYRNRVSLTKESRLAYYFGQVIPEVLKITFTKNK